MVLSSVAIMSLNSISKLHSSIEESYEEEPSRQFGYLSTKDVQ